MSDVSYVYGTLEYAIFEVEWTAPGVTFTAADWTAKVALCQVGTAFNAATATWATAALEVVGTATYAKVLIGSTLNPAVGTYKAFAKLTKTAGPTELPVIPCVGKLTVTAG
jgi:hypothetical protein